MTSKCSTQSAVVGVPNQRSDVRKSVVRRLEEACGGLGARALHVAMWRQAG